MEKRKFMVYRRIKNQSLRQMSQVLYISHGKNSLSEYLRKMRPCTNGMHPNGPQLKEKARKIAERLVQRMVTKME